MFDTKCANIWAGQYDGTYEAISRRAAAIPFAASGEYYQEKIRGRPAIANPPGTHSRFDRRNYSGSKAAKVADYQSAMDKGHLATMLLSEVTGAVHPEAERVLRYVAALHSNILPATLLGQSWTATTVVAYFLQRLSSVVNMAAAAEIRLQLCRGPRPVPLPVAETRYRAATAGRGAGGNVRGVPPVVWQHRNQRA